jgi:predicted nuclease of restriction endonuclease-like (RecB) superfamily
MRITRLEVRQFYEIEIIKSCWTVGELERQINSLLFDWLAKSRDKIGLMRFIYKGQEISKPEDVIKTPWLEFLDIPEAHQISETSLEEALITKLQHFLS